MSEVIKIDPAMQAAKECLDDAAAAVRDLITDAISHAYKGNRDEVIDTMDEVREHQLALDAVQVHFENLMFDAAEAQRDIIRMHRDLFLAEQTAAERRQTS